MTSTLISIANKDVAAVVLSELCKQKIEIPIYKLSPCRKYYVIEAIGSIYAIKCFIYRKFPEHSHCIMLREIK